MALVCFWKSKFPLSVYVQGRFHTITRQSYANVDTFGYRHRAPSQETAVAVSGNGKLIQSSVATSEAKKCSVLEFPSVTMEIVEGTRPLLVMPYGH